MSRRRQRNQRRQSLDAGKGHPKAASRLAKINPNKVQDPAPQVTELPPRRRTPDWHLIPKEFRVFTKKPRRKRRVP